MATPGQMEQVLGMFKTLGENMGIDTDHVLKELESKNINAKTLSDLSNALVSIPNLLKTKDGVKIMTALPEISQSMLVLLPLIAPIARSAVTFLVKVLNKIELRSTKTSTISTEIDDLFKLYREKDLQEKAAGVLRVFDQSLAFLNGVVSAPQLNPLQIFSLNPSSLLQNGTEFLGILGERILQLSGEKRQDPKETERLIRYIEIYLQSCAKRDIILVQAYGLAMSLPETEGIGRGLWGAMEKEHQQDSRIFAVIENPRRRIVFILQLLRSQHNLKFCRMTHDLMEKKSVFKLPRIDNINMVSVIFRTVKDMDWHVSTPNIPQEGSFEHISCANGIPKSKPLFVFIRKPNDECYYISPRGLRYKGMFLRLNTDGWVVIKKEQPGVDGEWNVVPKRRPDGYVLSTRKWPFKFLSMSGCFVHLGRSWLQCVERVPKEEETWTLEQIIPQAGKA